MTDRTSVAARERVEDRECVLCRLESYHSVDRDDPTIREHAASYIRLLQKHIAALTAHTDSIRAEERERCARVVEQLAHFFDARGEWGDDERAAGAMEALRDIRSLSPREE